MSNNNRVLFVVPILTHGGAERVVSVLSNALVRKGYKVAIAIYHHSPSEYETDRNVELYEVTTPIKIVKSLQRPFVLRRIFKTFHPDVIIPFLPLSVVDSYFACIGLRIPFISTVRNNPNFDNGLLGKLFKMVLNKSDAIYCQSNSQKNLLPDSIKNRVFVLPNPVSPTITNSYSERTYNMKTVRFISLGKLENQKNHKLMISAFYDAHRINPEITLEIYGDGKLRDELINLISDLHAEDYIYLRGRTEHVSDALLSADAFIFTSNYEGMPNALMEAMASGLPCISTNCPTGPSELIGNNERGILIPLEDRTALVDAICNFINNPDKCEEFGRMSHDYIKENYDADSISEQLMHMCFECTGGNNE